jgi:CubicO group peptidase (beta-lactamase class C family)
LAPMSRVSAMSRFSVNIAPVLAAAWALATWPMSAQPVAAQGAVPVFSQTGFDAEYYGEALGYPIGSPKDQENMVGYYSHFDRLFPTHAAAAADQPFPFKRAAQELSVTYTYIGVTYSLQNYLARNATTGFLIARGDTILFEHYQYGRTDHDRFMSQSVAKTVTSMLVGIAVAEGAIHSIDDAAQTYVPELSNTELGRTPIRALLHMASGLAFSQDDSGTDDAATLDRALFSRTGPGAVAAVSQFNTRIAPPDALWHDANLDSEILGLVVARATHVTLAQYLQTRIWRPMGAEADALWSIDNSGQEIAFCCLSATLRDYARFGLLLAHDGAFNGKQIIPRQWAIEATKAIAQGSLLTVEMGGHPWGYGYQLWVMPGPGRSFVLEGAHGQRIFVDPRSRLVLVHMAVRRPPVDDPREAMLVALWQSLIAHAGRD